MCPHPQPQICTPIIWWGPRTQPNFCLRFISPYFGSLFALLTVSVSHNSSGNSSGHYSDLIFGAWLSLLSSYLAILTDLSHNGESEIALVRFEGKNYTSWGYIDGSESKLKEDEKKISAWKTKDAKIKTSLLGSVEPHFILNLKPYKAACKMWDYLQKIYQQGNAARQVQLELDISQFTQGTLSIQEYNNGFRRLWSEYDEIKFATVSEAILPKHLPLQQNSHQDQFLIKFRPEFETVKSNLMSRTSLPSLDNCL
eukprot:TRINITY_DN7046_c1_g1_i2.p1 TRINITY_DN7046_c1_g1~~TRINITY_DN7046_c1_g1_i2.p1  ORF type:complete len:255 (-),score=22.81 TRINITY_DN7046_c1_g1_i2:217-981(-)